MLVGYTKTCFIRAARIWRSINVWIILLIMWSWCVRIWWWRIWIGWRDKLWRKGELRWWNVLIFYFLRTWCRTRRWWCSAFFVIMVVCGLWNWLDVCRVKEFLWFINFFKLLSGLLSVRRVVWRIYVSIITSRSDIFLIRIASAVENLICVCMCWFFYIVCFGCIYIVKDL